MASKDKKGDRGTAPADLTEKSQDIEQPPDVTCQNCQSLNAGQARFCGYCGRRIPKRFDGPRRTTPLRVRATETGYYSEQRYREGDVFVLRPPAEGQGDPFSEKWMEIVPDSTPERVTTGQQIIGKKNEETREDKQAEAAATGSAQVI